MVVTVNRASIAAALLSVLTVMSCPAAVALASAPPGSTSAPARHVQVVAHPDDDVLFMNPDLVAAIRTGVWVTSIFLTAGESDLADAPRYAASRQAGTRAAFATMARAADSWTRNELVLSPRQSAELYTLRQRPAVHLIFLNLPEDNDPAATGGKHALSRLWQDRAATLRTLVPADAAVHGSSTYDAADLVSVLTALFDQFRPTVIRTQDPEPDRRYQPQWGPHHDHPDHVMTARFVRAAQLRYGHAVRLLHYRDYNVTDAPPNLPPSEVRDKQEIFAAYAAHDPMVSMHEPYATWLRSMRRRWARPGGWAARDHLGRVNVVSVAGNEIVVDQQAGRSFLRASLSAGVDPVVASPVFGADPAGNLLLLVQDARTGDVVMTRQTPSGAWQPGWVPVSGASAGGSEAVGLPSAETTAQGRLIVAARNKRGGVSVLGADDRGWRDIGGADVVDEVSVIRDGQAAIHVFAPSAAGLLHWKQSSPREPLRLTTITAHRPSGALAVARSPAGAVYVAFREAGSGRLVVLTDRGAAEWELVASLYSAGMGAAPALALTAECGRDVAVLAVREERGTSVFRLGRGPVAERRFHPGNTAEEPGLTADAQLLVSVGDDGTPKIRSP